MFPARPRLAFLVLPKNPLSKYWETGTKIWENSYWDVDKPQECVYWVTSKRPALIRKCAFL